MDSKVIIIAVIAVVVVAGAGTGVYFLMNNNDDSEKEYNAQELAEKFIEDYESKALGEFTIVDGATDTAVQLTSTMTKYTQAGNENGDRVTNFYIYNYETEDAAHDAFLDYITNSKNGSDGTLLTLQTVLGMATEHLTIYDLREDSAQDDWGVDHAFIFYASYIGKKSTSSEFSQCAGALQDGKNVIVFNASTDSLYYNMPIRESITEGQRGILQADFESMLKDFCKAF